MFSRNIRYYRLMNRMSMDKLASFANISANAIKKYEHGEMMPSSETLEALATALQVSPLQLMQTWSADLSIEPLHHRSRKRKPERDKEAVQAATERVLGQHMTVLSLLSPSRVPVPDTLDQIIVSTKEQVEAVATHVRAVLGVCPSGPMPDMVALLENRGYLVVMIPNAPTWFDAEFGIVNGRPYIALADGRPPDRQRHSIAHELGHICMDIQDMEEETASSHFAGALLFPREDVFRELGHHRTGGIAMVELRMLQREYSVSMRSIIMRAGQLGVISQEAEKNLYKSLNMKGLSQDEHADIPREVPTAYRQWVVQLAMEHEISLSRGAELLDVDLGEMRNLLYGEDEAS